MRCIEAPPGFGDPSSPFLRKALVFRLFQTRFDCGGIPSYNSWIRGCDVFWSNVYNEWVKRSGNPTRRSWSRFLKRSNRIPADPAFRRGRAHRSGQAFQNEPTAVVENRIRNVLTFCRRCDWLLI